MSAQLLDGAVDVSGSCVSHCVERALGNSSTASQEIIFVNEVMNSCLEARPF